ncbi:MAG TPA: hypothetical protein VFX51_08725 [Solirubrobacteraceae bacterium]|nr:hypothetical protein [Solirubrobacteraceae bacterium]
MRLLIEFAAAATGTDGTGSTFDWLKIPGAIVAGLTILSYIVGVIRPFAVKKCRYWHPQGTTSFSFVVKNRSFLLDRTITGVTVVRAPGWFKRAFWPWWKRRAQQATFVPFGLPNPLPTVSKRNEVTLQGTLQQSGKEGEYDPTPPYRLLVVGGSRSSRTKRLKKFEAP